jgi:hypothetical protein
MSRTGAVLMAEFASADELLTCGRELRRRGYQRLDAFMPYPLHEAEEAFGLTRSRLPIAVLIAGLTGSSLAYLFQYWMAKVDYDINVGGRPSHAPLAFFPITFEMGVLLASFTALIGLLVVCGLPRLHHPVFEVEGFERASIDRFWVLVDERDPLFERGRTEEELRSFGALRVVYQERAS